MPLGRPIVSLRRDRDYGLLRWRDRRSGLGNLASWTSSAAGAGVVIGLQLELGQHAGDDVG
jgi:hypothetical protein